MGSWWGLGLLRFRVWGAQFWSCIRLRVVALWGLHEGVKCQALLSSRGILLTWTVEGQAGLQGYSKKKASDCNKKRPTYSP